MKRARAAERSEGEDAVAPGHKCACTLDAATACPTKHVSFRATDLLRTLRSWTSGIVSNSSKDCLVSAFTSPQDDKAVRISAMNQQALDVLGDLSDDIQLQEAVLLRYQLQEDLSSTSALVGGALLTSLAFAMPSAAKAAVLFGCAANSVMHLSHAVAWHHYVLLQCPQCTISLELLKRGVCVRIISQRGPRGRQLLHQHRQELKTYESGTRVKVAEELQCVELDCGLGLQPVLKWLSYVVSQQYDILNWNCQHFSQDLMSVLSTFVKTSVRSCNS